MPANGQTTDVATSDTVGKMSPINRSLLLGIYGVRAATSHQRSKVEAMNDIIGLHTKCKECAVRIVRLATRVAVIQQSLVVPSSLIVQGVV